MPFLRVKPLGGFPPLLPMAATRVEQRSMCAHRPSSVSGRARIDALLAALDRPLLRVTMTGLPQRALHRPMPNASQSYDGRVQDDVRCLHIAWHLFIAAMNMMLSLAARVRILSLMRAGKADRRSRSHRIAVADDQADACVFLSSDTARCNSVPSTCRRGPGGTTFYLSSELFRRSPSARLCFSGPLIMNLYLLGRQPREK
jgi:hypothetical protein